ncbi:SO_0444 family Cu/Zn efflux transporter [Candidatus Sumerlaeota bacterium]|nr:SO_0444 family Cu/Zn efflux transporter [Candidatus Sumerlaeota bacterium]
MHTINQIFLEIYWICAASGWYLLGGVAVAGLIHVFINPKRIRRFLGGYSISSVFRAALVGVPLPLCSCSVIPVAAGLRKDGASKGAITSFMISTPESGVDSIAVSWALLDPVLTVMRVVAAFVTALTGGLAVVFFGGESSDETAPNAEPADCHAHQESVTQEKASCCGDTTKKAESKTEEASACCNSKAAQAPSPVSDCCSSAQPSPEKTTSCCGAHSSKPDKANETMLRRLWSSQRYAFGTLLPDFGKYFFWGLLATGVIAAFMPDDFFGRFAGGGLPGMIAVMFVGIPIYICATASTPVAAMFIAGGMSPGTALVMLLAGPATNVATMSVVRKMLGGRGLAIYLSSIAFCSLALGLLTDAIWRWFYPLASYAEKVNLHAGHEAHLGFFMQAGGALLIAVLLWIMLKPLAKKIFSGVTASKACCAAGSGK